MKNGQDILWLAENLFGAYFHPEWPAEFESVSDVIEYILRVSPASEIEKNVNSLRSILTQWSDDELQKLLVEELDCSYNPAEQGLTVRQWLNSLVEQFMTLTPGIGPVSG